MLTISDLNEEYKWSHFSSFAPNFIPQICGFVLGNESAERAGLLPGMPLFRIPFSLFTLQEVQPRISLQIKALQRTEQGINEVTLCEDHL